MGEHQRSSQPCHSDTGHADVRASLPEYATALVLSQNHSARYSVVAAHLENCSTCRAELETLLELVRPAYTGQVVPAPSVPQFDLSFLSRPLAEPAATRPIRMIDDLRELVILFSDALLASIRLPTLAQAARGEALYRFTPDPLPPGNVKVTIDVFAGDDDPELGNVQVLVDVPSRDPFDQAGIRVALRVGDLVWEGSTSETGSVTFTAVPLKLLPHLRVEIALPQ